MVSCPSAPYKVSGWRGHPCSQSLSKQVSSRKDTQDAPDPLGTRCKLVLLPNGPVVSHLRCQVWLFYRFQCLPISFSWGKVKLLKIVIKWIHVLTNVNTHKEGQGSSLGSLPWWAGTGVPTRVTSGSFHRQQSVHLSERTRNQGEGREWPACAPPTGKQGLLCWIHTVRGGDRGDGGEACMCFFFTKHPLPTSPLLQLSGCNRDGEMCPLNMEQNQWRPPHLTNTEILDNILSSCQKCASGNIHIKKKRPYLGLPWESSSYESPCNAGDLGSIPGRGTKIPQAAEQLSPSATTAESWAAKILQDTTKIQPVNK